MALKPAEIAWTTRLLVRSFFHAVPYTIYGSGLTFLVIILADEALTAATVVMEDFITEVLLLLLSRLVVILLNTFFVECGL